jgi:hypothetical protein
MAKNDPMAAPGSDTDKLERVLLRRCLGVLEEDRDRCSDCGRTPLVGERVHSYDERGGEIVCDLCRGGRRDEPLASRRARHPFPIGAVRLTARAA